MKIPRLDRTRLRIWFGRINIALVALILSDSYIFSPMPFNEIVTDKEVRRGTGSRNRPYTDFILYSDEGNVYKVPSITYSKLEPGDTFMVARTLLFKRPLRISYTSTRYDETYGSGEFYVDIAMVKNSWWITGAALLAMAISVWMLFFYRSIHQPDDVKLRMLLIADFILAPLAVFYFLGEN